MSGSTMFDKIWDAHVVTTGEDGTSLMYVDRHLIHEASVHAFNSLRETGRKVRRPRQTFAVADHYVPTAGNDKLRVIDKIGDTEVRELVRTLHDNAERAQINLFGWNEKVHGIVHVIGPEQGITQPGLTIICGDSHTSTHGALGALAFGVGASEVAHVLATQTLWQRRPAVMRVRVDGKLPFGVGAKDIILSIIGKIGAGGAAGYAIEYAGTTIESLSVEQRMTICNMSIEAGGRCGMVAPDEKTYDYLNGRRFAPKGAERKKAIEYWSSLPSAPDAVFDREVELDGAMIKPNVTWGTSPEDVVPIDAVVPNPGQFSDPGKARRAQKALDYMGLEAGTPMTEIPVDFVFIGSCTNSRIEDLRTAAEVLQGRKVKVDGMVVPGSGVVKEQAESEGLDKIFTDAGLQWRDSGCSMCLGINGDLLAGKTRCASTSNRNFEGRQGRGARTHLVSPAMAAAAAVSGHFADVRTFLRD